MVEEFEYSKERKKFGRHPQFEDTESKIVGSINPSQNTEPYVLRDPNKLILDNIPQMSEHRVSISCPHAPKPCNVWEPAINPAFPNWPADQH